MGKIEKWNKMKKQTCFYCFCVNTKLKERTCCICGKYLSFKASCCPRYNIREEIRENKENYIIILMASSDLGQIT